eukprot:m51a1_g11388 purine-nucleoside phosphorylase, putative (323) ;mRNA; r:14479-15658
MGAGPSAHPTTVAVTPKPLEVAYPLPESTLPRTPRNTRVYHLALSRDGLARNIILVGDPERVPLMAEKFLAGVEADANHRGLRSITGRTRGDGTRVSIVTSGMGPLNIIRVGTCGALHEDVPLGTAIVSAYSVGLDSLGLFYDTPAPDAECEALERNAQTALEQSAREGSRFGTRMRPYVSRSNPAVVRAIQDAAKDMSFERVRVGITACAPGFFAPQGRVLLGALAPTVPDIDFVLSGVGVETPEVFKGPGVPERLRIENMEMETSAVLHMCGALGYNAAAVCLTVAHRRKNTFLAAGQADVVLEMAAVAVHALELLDKRS